MKQLLMNERVSEVRPYEKCRRFGASHLTDTELLAIMIRTGVNGMNAEALAMRILNLPGGHQGLAGLGRLTAEDFMTIPGIGEVKAIQLEAISELAVRIASIRAEAVMRFDDPSSVAGYYMEQLRNDTQENVIVLMLDSGNRFLGDEVLTRGTVNASLVSTRDIFLQALKHRASSIMLIHNHPGGDPTPSAGDAKVTRKVYKAGNLLDVPLMDHIIIGDGRYISFKENGFLEPGSMYVQ